MQLFAECDDQSRLIGWQYVYTQVCFIKMVITIHLINTILVGISMHV